MNNQKQVRDYSHQMCLLGLPHRQSRWCSVWCYGRNRFGVGLCKGACASTHVKASLAYNGCFCIVKQRMKVFAFQFGLVGVLSSKSYISAPPPSHFGAVLFCSGLVRMYFRAHSFDY
jgi:hypothetical protein